MSEPKKLTLEEKLAEMAIDQHNSAITNAALVLQGITEVRRMLTKELEKLAQDETYVTKLAQQTEEDPISVNDDEKLHTLYVKYGNRRGGTYPVDGRSHSAI